MCASDVDAVLIFTGRVHHFPFAKMAMQSGKHVYTAVPMADTLEEMGELVELVKSSGLVYQMGETRLYYPANVYCRKRFERGDFGRFIYGEGEYYHDMADQNCGFYDIYQKAHGEDWRKFAGFPPMLYPTHSVAMVLGVTGARMPLEEQAGSSSGDCIWTTLDGKKEDPMPQIECEPGRDEGAIPPSIGERRKSTTPIACRKVIEDCATRITARTSFSWTTSSKPALSEKPRPTTFGTRLGSTLPA